MTLNELRNLSLKNIMNEYDFLKTQVLFNQTLGKKDLSLLLSKLIKRVAAKNNFSGTKTIENLNTTDMKLVIIEHSKKRSIKQGGKVSQDSSGKCSTSPFYNEIKKW